MAIRKSAAPAWRPSSPPRCWPNCRRKPTRRTAKAGALLAAFSEAAYRAYRGLVYETPNFEVYFREATPLLEIADLKIGSRPASRTQSGRIEDLRAIPWVFSWSQARVMLPGWFGFGSAAAKIGADKLRPLYKASASFRTTIANMEMVLAKSSMPIARRYAELVEDRALAEDSLRPHRSRNGRPRWRRCWRSAARRACWKPIRA